MSDMTDKKVGAQLHVSIDKGFLEPVVARAVVELGGDFEEALAKQIGGAVKNADLAGMIEEQVARAAKGAVSHAIYKANIQDRMDEQALTLLAQLVRSGARTSRIEAVIDRNIDTLMMCRDTLMSVEGRPYELGKKMDEILKVLREARKRQPDDDTERPVADGEKEG